VSRTDLCIAVASVAVGGIFVWALFALTGWTRSELEAASGSYPAQCQVIHLRPHVRFCVYDTPRYRIECIQLDGLECEWISKGRL